MAPEKTPKIENNLDAPLKLGDYVRIRHSGWRRGRIVELRGPLGPQGAQIYRVMVKRKPKPVFIEAREDQLEPVAAES